MSHVGGATRKTIPNSRSALEKNPMTYPSSKATLWVKARHEGALTPLCIVRENPQVPHTAQQVACHSVNNSKGKGKSIPPHKMSPDSPLPTLQEHAI